MQGKHLSIKQVLIVLPDDFYRNEPCLMCRKTYGVLKMCYLLLLMVSSMKEVTMSDFVYHEIRPQGPAPGTQ